MIIRSGFNVYPGEIEAVLMRFQGIRCAAVVGRREPDGNEQILAFVEAESSEKGMDMEALKVHLQEHLAAYKQPSHVIQVESMPMTLSGKVLKRTLLETYSHLLAAD